MELSFVPVKILDKNWADELISGSIYMRPLRKFGSWDRLSEANNTTLSNDFRGDIREGVVKYFVGGDDPDLAFLPEDLRAVIQSAAFIDDTDIKFFRLFCLYCLRYSSETHSFELPSCDLAEFGDTAVIITDFNEFIRRFLTAIFKRFPDPLSVLMDEVQYFSSKETQSVIPMFSKIDYYGWQNEFRFAFGELNADKTDPSGEAKWPAIETDSPITLDVGNISDIAFEVPISDFLMLNFETSKISVPLHLEELYSKAINDTRSQMSAHRPIAQKFIFSI